MCLNAAEKILPGTETTAEIKSQHQRRLRLSVPASEHLYDGRVYWRTTKTRS